MISMAQQLVFDLPVRNALGREDFFVSSANEVAVARIANWEDWDSGKMLLCGPEGSGKTHLAHVWAKEADALIVEASDLNTEILANLKKNSLHIVIENVGDIAGHIEKEQVLFHLHNLVLSGRGRLLMTGQLSPLAWHLSLPDLKSRLLGTEMVRLDAPDDMLLSAVLLKLFSDRQIDVTLGVVGFIIPRIERSFAAISQLVTIMDTLALSQHSPVTRKIAQIALDKYSASVT